MERTRQALEGLLHYDEAAAIRPLETVTIEKEDIPRHVVCPGYERAQSRVERSMERYTARVARTDDRLRQSKQNIAELEDAVEQWAGRAKGVSTFKELTLDRSSASSVDSYNRDVARHNDALDQARRYQDRLEDAIDKHNDLIERHNEAVREAEERLEELSLEALGQIDEDLVSFFERCRSVIEKLKDAEDTQDILACAETSFMGLKLHNAFELHIDGATTRREAREQVAAIADALFELCSMKEFRESMEGLFRSNIHLMEENAEQHTRVLNLISGANPEELTSARQTLSALLSAKFATRFSYVGIVDPVELEAIINRMQSTVEDIKTSSADIQELHRSSASLAEAAVAAQAEAESTLMDMNAAVIQSRDTILFPGHFACDIVDPDVIDVLFKSDLQKAVYAVRQQLSDSLGGEAVDSLIAGVDDRFWTSRTEESIARAELSALQVERDKVESRVRRNSALIPGIAEQIHFAEAVPSQNAEKFRSLASILYPLSCFPIFGFIAAWFMLNKIEAFASAFSSSNRVYTELKVETAITNARYKKINTYVFINIISALVFARIEKRLVGCSTGDALALESDRTAIGD